MWCIGRLTTEYCERMHALCDLYARPYDPQQPVVCLDEKSKQLLRSSRPGLPERSGQVTKEDYEYVRRGTRNIFMAVEPLGGHRETTVTTRRTKADFVQFVCGLLDGAYRQVTKLHLVLDNLNTHFRGSFEAVLGDKAVAVLQRLEFHHTPKHASWLNLAELELGIMERQCTGRRLATPEILVTELHAWQQQRNDAKARLHWNFTRQDADRKLGRHYVT
jgi:hypothetical protein